MEDGEEEGRGGGVSLGVALLPHHCVLGSVRVSVGERSKAD